MNRQDQIKKIRASQQEAKKGEWFWDKFDAVGDWGFEHPVLAFLIAATGWTLLMIFLLSVVSLGVYFVVTAVIGAV